MPETTSYSTRHRRILTLIALVLVGFLILKVQFGATSSAHSSAKTSSTRKTAAKTIDASKIKEDYGKLPARFEANRGQTDKQAKYFARSNGYTAFYTASEIVLALRKPTQAPANPEQSSPSIEYSVLRMKLRGANKDAAIIGEDELPGATNYYIGNDPKKWRTNVPSYRGVRYQAIYDGIDMVHYGNGGELEYDFVVQPGADSRRIQMEFSGIHELQVARDGSLIFKTPAGKLRHSRPYAYQELNGIKQEVESHFTRRGNKIGIEVGQYDRTRKLTIDPSLTYSTFLGGTGPDFGSSIAVDTSGNAYLTGYTSSADFPQVNATRPRAADFDCYIAKLNSAGNALIYSTYLGGASTDRAYGITIDSVNNVYVTGQTFSSDFPKAGTLQLFLRGSSDAFVTKLTFAGVLTYSTLLGGEGVTDVGYSIAVDSVGQMYVTGETDSPTFPTQPIGGTSNGGGRDAFVTKINAAGNALLYSAYLGGNGNDAGNGIVVDTSGNAYVAGATNSTNFPVTAGVVKSTNSTAQDDAFVTKFNTTGARTYSTYFGGVNSRDRANAIAIDSTGNAYITGSTNYCCITSDFPVISAAQSTPGGVFSDDAFVAKLNTTATSIGYSTFLGGDSYDVGNSIAVDSSNSAYVTGYTASSNFPPVNPLMPALNGNSDAFITKIGPLGSFGFSTYLGGATYDEGKDIALDASGNVYVTGQTNFQSSGASDFPTTTGALQTLGSGADAFVTKLNPSGVTPYILGVASTPAGDLLPNVAISLTGTQSKASLTDANGRYVFQLLPSGSYTVTPGNYNYAFNPPNRPYASLTTPQTAADFSAVTLLNDNLANALSLSGALGTAYYGANFGATKECTEAPHAGNPANASVWYRWTAPPVSGTVFVSTRGTSIDTLLDVYAGSNLNVCSLPTPVASNDDVAIGDFTSRVSFFAAANTTYYIAIDTRFPTGPFKLTIDRALTISGKAQNVNGRGLQGITISLTGDVTASMLTNINGDFSFVVPAGGNYTVTASDSSVQLWEPTNWVLNNLQSDETGLGFTAKTPSPSITGELKNLTLGASDISVSVGGSGLTAKPCSVTTNAGVSTYTCSNLNVHGDYVVSPSSPTYAFDPTTQTFDNVLGSIFQGPGSDFTGTASPIATTVGTSAIGGTTATLNGTANPRGSSTSAAFLWSTTPTFDTYSSTPYQSVGNGNAPVAYSASLTGLAPGTTYYFRAYAVNPAVSYGNVMSFTTLPQITIQTNPVGLKVSIDNGPLVTAPQTLTRTPGSSLTIATASPQAGAVGTQYTFSGWNDGLGISHVVTVPSTNTTYTASFNTQYMLTMNAGSNGSVGPVSGFFNSGQNVQITATPNSGFSFGGWTGTGAGSYTGSNNPGTVTMNGPVTETASFGQNTVQLTVQTNPAGRTISIDGGAPLVAPQTITRTPGTSLTISTTSPQAGAVGTQYVFTGWSDGLAISHTVTVPGVNTTYTASFNTQYMLTMNAGSGGTVGPASGFFNSGQNVQITATPNSGFSFGGWIGSGAGSYTGNNNSPTVTMSGPITESASFTTTSSAVAFSAATYPISESAGSLTVTVNRSGNTAGSVSVDYKTTDTDTFTVGCSDAVNNLGGAYGRCDYATSVDTLTFASGETTKTFQIPIINDVFHETNETFSILLSNPVGATLGTNSSAVVTINDNDAVDGANPIFTTPFFVRQHYLDFLSREPEAGEPWSAVLNNCSDVNNNPACDRLTVSASFFGSPEFQLKGYFVYRFYKLAFNRLPTYPEIVTDMRAVTGQTPAEVFQKKATFTNAFVQRTEFTNAFGGLTNGAYVTALMGRYSLTQVTTPDPAAPDGSNKVTLTTAALTNQLNAATLTRAQVLRAIADSDQVFSLEFNQAFVAMQYYGYLRRTPDAAGFNGWLNYLNGHPTDSRTMVRGFMDSTEYRLRFGPLP